MSQVAEVHSSVVADARQSNTFTPAMLLQMAAEQGATIEKLQQLMELRDRWEGGEARKAFVSAMAEFKTQPVDVYKNKRVNFTSSKGTVDYMHAELADVCDALVPALARVGIAHRWDVTQEDGQIVVTCRLTHRLGHSETMTLRGPKDDSGTKNSIQAVGSTITYLQRYTLLSITGTATKSQVDDDGKEGGGEPEEDRREQAPRDPLLDDGDISTIEILCKEIGPKQLNAILGAYKVKKLGEIPKRCYASIVERLNAKRAGMPS